MNIKDSGFENILSNSRNALLIGIGGGGDIVGTIPTSGLFKLFGIKCYYAGLPWERSVIDPVPGPRNFDGIMNIRKFNEHIWIANRDTITLDGVKFAESYFADIVGDDVYLIDLSQGVLGIIEGLTHLCRENDIDLVAGIDVGGDCISFGDEPGLQSPLADSMMLAALYNISQSLNTIIGLFGSGGDGELTPVELETSLATIAANSGYYGAWGITGNTRKLMEKAVSLIPTEASRVGLDSSKGELKTSSIRSGTIKIKPQFSSNLTYYLSTQVIYEKVSATARNVNNTGTFIEANTRLNKLGLTTEYDLEMKKFKFTSEKK